MCQCAAEGGGLVCFCGQTLASCPLAPYRWVILPLHAALPLEAQEKVFDVPPDGVRKVGGGCAFVFVWGGCGYQPNKPYPMQAGLGCITHQSCLVWTACSICYAQTGLQNATPDGFFR